MHSNFQMWSLVLFPIILLPFLASAQTGGALCNSYAPGSTPPAGYGAAWNVLSSTRGLLLSAHCHTNGSINYTVGHPESPDTHYAYKVAYYYQGSWLPMTLTGTFAEGSADWLLREGYIVRAALPPEDHFWVGYVCQWEHNAWKCGCRDAACAVNYWQLQQVVRDSATGTTGGSTGGATATTGGTTGGGSQTNAFPSSGPVIKVPSLNNSTYKNTGRTANTVFDARGSALTIKWPGFVSDRTIENANVSSGSNGITWYGGYILYDVPVNLSYQDHYHPRGSGTINHHAVMIGNSGEGARMIAGRLDNVWDGWRPTKSENFVIKGTMATHVHDDAVENDNFAAGVIEDNYWEGYGMYSARSGGYEGTPENKTVTIRNNIWRIYGFPVDPGKKTPQGAGHLFKVHGGFAPGDGMGTHTRLRIIDNWFLVEDIRYTEFAGHNQDKLLGIPEEMAVEISNNHLVWCPRTGSPATFPGHVPAKGVTVYDGCQYKHLWEEQRDRWLATHKEVDQRPSVFKRW